MYEMPIKLCSEPDPAMVERLMEEAKDRERTGQDPLYGMSVEEISVIAWALRISYGKLRAHVNSYGKLPKKG